MKLTEEQKRGMTKDSAGNYHVEIVESKPFGSHPYRAVATQRPTRTHAQSLASIKESCLRQGMSAAEADKFVELGERG